MLKNTPDITQFVPASAKRSELQRSPNYAFTTKKLTSTAMTECRRRVKAHNRQVRQGVIRGEQFDIITSGRFGKNNPNVHMYGSHYTAVYQRGKWGLGAPSDAHAARFDVYIRPRK